jgi:5-methylcytosine-specific restriction endonuclease McrA
MSMHEESSIAQIADGASGGPETNVDNADGSSALEAVCAALAVNGTDNAHQILTTRYPHARAVEVTRTYSAAQKFAVFRRDGFIDRYTGRRLVNPGVLRLIHVLSPEVFPFHTNWKMTETHIAFWELLPTIDHVVPVAREGADDETNWVTTSMRTNSAKGMWTLDELGWQLQAPGDMCAWDGLTGWFVKYLTNNPLLGADTNAKYVRSWFNVSCAHIRGD